MLSDSRFWVGVLVGWGSIYLYHRVKGIPSNAPGSNRSA